MCETAYIDGKAKVAKHRIEAIDEEKVLEGDLLELYKSLVLSYQVDTRVKTTW